MTIAEIVKGYRYSVRGDIVDVINVVQGATPRSARAHYVMVKKGRPLGALEVGEIGEMGVVNFASWGRRIGKTPRSKSAKARSLKKKGATARKRRL